MELTSRIFVAGHRGLVGSAILETLKNDGFTDLAVRSSAELDLRDRDAVFATFRQLRPEYVILAAAKVGGIAANMSGPVEFLVDNLMIQNNVLEASLEVGVRRAVFLGSSCIYPREAPQPMREDYYMQGPVEPTNESYAIAKIAGITLARALWSQHGMSVLLPMPCNVYGRRDHFDLARAHVVPALVRRFAEARAIGAESVVLWGTGSARRELLHADDLADAVLFLLRNYERPDIINVGTGSDVSISELAGMIAKLVDYRGRIEWDANKPDGMPQKLLDVSRINALGWRHRIDLAEGLRTVVEDYAARTAAA